MVISFYLKDNDIDVSCDSGVPLSRFTMINIQTLHKMGYYQNKQSGIWETKHEEQMAALEGGGDEQGVNVTDIGDCSSQPFNIENAFQSIMTKLT